MAGIRYKGQIFSGAASFGDADHVAYDNSESGLEATDVQGALDEVNSKWKISTDLTIKDFNDFPVNSIYHIAGTGYQNSPVSSGTCYGVVETIAGGATGYRIQTASLISNGNISKISIRSYAEGSWYPWHDMNHDIKRVKVYEDQVSISTSSTDITFTLPSDFHTSYGVILTRSWPTSTWSNGAVVTIAQDSTITGSGVVRLASTYTQIYNLRLDLVYE